MPKNTVSKKTKKISFASQNKKPLLVLVAVLFIAIGIVAVVQSHAASSSISICNSSDSYSRTKISPYVTPYPTDKSSIDRGQCSSKSNGSGQARVRVPLVKDDNNGYNLKSYRIKPNGGSYGPCHNVDVTNGYTTSNPEDVSLIYYKTYQHQDCN
jgi:hypothetical protein